MKTEIQLKYSWMYNSLFNKNFKKSDLKKLKEKCKQFEKLYSKNIQQILKLISKHFSSWKENYIPIFIIKEGSVFCDPITIRYEGDPKIMLIRLFHELIHVNINKKKFKNEYEMHKYMDKKMIPLLNKIPTDLTKEVHILERMTNKWKEKCAVK